MSQIQFLEINMKYIEANMPKTPSVAKKIANMKEKYFLVKLSWK